MLCPVTPLQSFDVLIPARNQGVCDAQWDAKKQPAAGRHYWESETWDPAADREMQHGEAGAMTYGLTPNSLAWSMKNDGRGIGGIEVM